MNATVVELTAAQQRSQMALTSMLVDPLDAAWSVVNQNDPASMSEYIASVVALTKRFGLVSANRSAAYYEAVRKAEGFTSSFHVPLAPTAPLDKVTTSVRWATKDLWSPEPSIEEIKARVHAVTTKNVLDAGRMTVLNTANRDRRSHGWAREVEPGCCSFCAMLATRGAVYKSDQSASFEAHDHCHCIAVPTFSAYEPTAQVREWQQLYKSSTRGVRGSANMRNAFRQAFDAANKTS